MQTFSAVVSTLYHSISVEGKLFKSGGQVEGKASLGVNAFDASGLPVN